MEQLAIRDVFGCMTTELAPSILQDAFTPWFFEAESWSRTDLEWESVERMFGISRGMVDMIARVSRLISVRQARLTLDCRCVHLSLPFALAVDLFLWIQTTLPVSYRPIRIHLHLPTILQNFSWQRGT